MGVSRLSHNENVEFWDENSGTIPNGTLAINSSLARGHYGTGRILVIFYAGEDNVGGFAPTISIGGQNPTVQYDNVFALSTDLNSLVAIWDEVALRAMTDFTITTGGTYPVTTAEAWGWNLFANIDQEHLPSIAENYSEHSSVTTFDITTTSDGADDFIIALCCSNSGTVEMTDSDTLHERMDFPNGGLSMRIGAHEGDGGDDTTTITVASSTSWSAYGLVFKYKRQGLVMHWSQDAGGRSTTNNSFVDVNSLAEIAACQIMPSREYLILAMCMTGGSVNSVNQFESRLADNNGNQYGKSRSRIEPRHTSINDGHQCFVIDKYTAQAIIDVGDQIEWQMASDGTNSVHVAWAWVCAIDLSDMTVCDFVYDSDETSYTALDNVSWTDGASITLPTEGDWLIGFNAHIIVDSSSTKFKIRLDVAGSPEGRDTSFEGEDGIEERVFGQMFPVAALAAGTVCKVQFQTDSATAGQMDVDQNRIFAIRLDQFEDHFLEFDGTDTTISVVDSDVTMISTPHTSDTDAEVDWIAGAMSVIEPIRGNNSTRVEYRMENSSGGLDVAGTNTQRTVSAGTNDVVAAGPVMGWIDSWPDADARTYVHRLREESDVPVDYDDHWQWGFSVRFADPHLPFYPKRTNTLLRM